MTHESYNILCDTLDNCLTNLEGSAQQRFIRVSPEWVKFAEEATGIKVTKDNAQEIWDYLQTIIG